MKILTCADIDNYCNILVNKIGKFKKKYEFIYPIPMGGYPVANKLSNLLKLPIIENIVDMKSIIDNVLIVDDVIDSGETIGPYMRSGLDIAVLIIKNFKLSEENSYCTNHIFYGEYDENWIQFPWEQNNTVEKNIIRIFQYIGENPKRQGLVDTPKRIVKMYDEIFKGYKKELKPEITVFNNGSDGVIYDEMIYDEGEFYSVCEHHMIPFFGKYYFAYIPHLKGKILGLSKVARIVDYYSARLQIQERLVSDIVNCLWEALCKDTKFKPLGMALMMEGEHLCKSMRGVKKQGVMKTSKLLGEFQKIEVKNEFLQLIK